MIRISRADIQEIEEHFQNLVNKGPAQLITVVWEGNIHRVFTPIKQDDGQLTLDGMDLPEVRKILQKTGEGE